MGFVERIKGFRNWDPIFVRHLNDWEVNEMESLYLRLDLKRACVELEDKPKWGRPRMMTFL